MADKQIVLLDSLCSPFGLRARIALAEKGIDYEYKEQNLVEKSSLLLQMNPVHKKIPVLIHNGRSICESLNIVEYIDEVWKNPPLLPQDPHERAVARFWADFIDKKIYDSGSRIWKNKGEAQETAKEEFIENLKLIQGALKEKPFFGGHRFGFVDVALIPFSCWFYVYETFGNFKIEEDCPELIAWVKRSMERESVSKELPDPYRVYDSLVGSVWMPHLSQ